MKYPSWLKHLFGPADGRCRLRMKADFEATLSGSFGMLEVTAVDANRDSAGVRSRAPLAAGTLAFLRIGELGLMGFVHVRRCSPTGDGYLLGLQFREALAHDRSNDGGEWTRRRIGRCAYRVLDEADI